MKTAVVKLSDIARTDRWDAKFHIARVNNQPAVDKLMAMPIVDFNRLFKLVPAQKEHLEVVIRGRGTLSGPSMEAMRRYTREEKAVYLALCLNDVNRLEEEAARLDKMADAIRRRQGLIQRLNERKKS